ncbi:unnamed protein product [Ilex paraguariensis]|uniref:Uncharacterized protein n=1 Tax=Ilex paraguariensis TaxID=185542 RepID=A0ABC8QZF4_9AQUA
MAEAVTEVPQTITEPKTDNPATQDMELETLSPSDSPQADSEPAVNGESNSMREREEEGEEEENNGESKKQKIEKSVEEQRLESLEGSEGVDGEEKGSDLVSVGPKRFGSSVEMFDYFYKFLHYWSPNLNVNKYEYTVLLELIKKGHLEADKKIGEGIHAFQVRYHPQFKSRCFFLIRNDKSVDDFSFRKCVEHILPLPENMQLKADVNKVLGGRRGGGGCGRGRGGKWRN